MCFWIVLQKSMTVRDLAEEVDGACVVQSWGEDDQQVVK